MNKENKTKVAMTGDGYYSLATKGAKDVIDAATPLVKQALASMAIEQESRAFTMTDMGCADGGTSLTMVGEIIKSVHQQAARFAREYIPTLRSWTESTFFGGLSAQRPEQERQEIMEQFYATYESNVREQPVGHAMDYVHAYMIISKQIG